MSNLRKIMQRLSHIQPDLNQLSHQPVDRKEARLKLHLEAYQKHLADCTPAMLQYELVWLDEHILSLELCLNQPEMLSAAGGSSQVEQWLVESRRCKEALEETMTHRGVGPAPHPHAIATSEHAWELREEKIKKLWGLT